MWITAANRNKEVSQGLKALCSRVWRIAQALGVVVAEGTLWILVTGSTVDTAILEWRKQCYPAAEM